MGLDVDGLVDVAAPEHLGGEHARAAPVAHEETLHGGFGVGVPGHFDHDGLAALKLDEARGHFLDFRGQALGLQLGHGHLAEKLAGDRHGSGRAHQVPREVEQVNADVAQRAEPGQALLKKPDAAPEGAVRRHVEMGPAFPAVPGGARVIHVAELAAVGVGFHQLRLGPEPQGLFDHEQLARLLCGIGHLLGIGRRDGHGFFDQDMLALAQGIDGHRGMERVGHGDGDRVQLVHREHALRAGEHVFGAVLAGKLLRLRFVQVADGQDFDARHLAEPFHMIPPESRTHDAHPQRFHCHDAMLLSTDSARRDPARHVPRNHPVSGPVRPR